MSRKDRIRRHYEPRIRVGREHFDILDWASAASQEARFGVLADRVELAGRSLLDVGCGLGDLWAYLRRRNIAVDYTGVDLLEKMVSAARARHSEARFVCGDVFTQDLFPPESFDVAFCSGMFNLNLGNNLEFLPRAVGRLLGLVRGTLAINLLHRRRPPAEDRYFCYDPQEVRKLLEPLCGRITILDDYLPNDFTVLCGKKKHP
ncbi:MAG TPA: class I SAM-dependent methyltransferase [Phycisphaerales bacterium]|nr:class I SAM-dependent methyltransferase [Phycisphaerales bacterium]